MARGSHAVTLTSGRGVETVRAAAVLLATGCRERPRAARLIPGDRPAGVMTTGELQQRVYLGHERLAGRALVVGAEHVSFSAAVTLAHAGARVVALVTEHERQQSYAAFRLGAALRWRVPVWTVDRGRPGGRPGAAGRGGGGGRPHRRGAVRAVRRRGLHRRLDPRSRAGPAGRAGHGSRHPRTRGRHEAGDVGAGRVRRGQPGARGRDRGHRRAVRPARGPADRRRARWPGPGGRRRGRMRRRGAGTGRAAAAVDLAERDRVRCPSPAGPVRAAQPGVPRAGPARGAAGRPAAGPVTPGPAGAGAAACTSALPGWPGSTPRAARCASRPVLARMGAARYAFIWFGFRGRRR